MSKAQFDDPAEVERVIYLSWHPDSDGLSAECLRKLQDALEENNIDESGRQISIRGNDVQTLVAMNAADRRRLRDDVSDFVGLFTPEYVISARNLCKKGEEPDLIYFVNTRITGAESGRLTMWILPIDALTLKQIGFREAGLANLDFPWWHGFRANEGPVPMPGADLESKQKFRQDIRRRVSQMLTHPKGCEPCGTPHHHEAQDAP